MASYHLSVKTHSRSKNANAVALASYRSGERLWDEAWQCYKNCRKSSKSKVLHNELFNSQLMNREQLWNAAEKAETRKNSVVAKEIEIALPIDISDTKKVTLARDFSKYLAKRYNCAIDLAVHAPDSDSDFRNYHAHILMTTRQMQDGVIGPKWRQLDQPEGKGRMEIKELRKEFEIFQNKILEKEGSQERVFSGRAEEEDRPKKYRALPFRRYQVLRRTDRLEEFKEVSSVEEFNRWKSRKDLTIKDLMEQIKELKKIEEKQRREGYGTDGIKPGSDPGFIERAGNSPDTQRETGTAEHRRETADEIEQLQDVFKGRRGQPDSGSGELNDQRPEYPYKQLDLELKRELEEIGREFQRQGDEALERLQRRSDEVQRNFSRRITIHADTDQHLGENTEQTEQNYRTHRQFTQTDSSGRGRVWQWIINRQLFRRIRWAVGWIGRKFGYANNRLTEQNRDINDLSSQQSNRRIAENIGGRLRKEIDIEEQERAEERPQVEELVKCSGFIKEAPTINLLEETKLLTRREKRQRALEENRKQEKNQKIRLSADDEYRGRGMKM